MDGQTVSFLKTCRLMESTHKITAKLTMANIIVAKLFSTSHWFSVNASAPDLARGRGLTSGDIGLLAYAVQLGFIMSSQAHSPSRTASVS